VKPGVLDGTMKTIRRHFCLLLFLPVFLIAEEKESKPDQSSAVDSIETILLDPVDSRRDRTVPLKVYLPAEEKPLPVVLFSHGLGGSRDGNPYLGEHWALHGYVAIFMQHIGSDRSLWEAVEPAQRMEALKGGAGLKQTIDRVQDIPFVIDQLETWDSDPEHPLYRRIDLEHIGLSGHSYGAVTTLAVTGRTFGNGRQYREPRIDAFLPMSPQPGDRPSPSEAFGKVEVPILCMTGTRDGSPIDPSLAPETRQEVYRALPPGDKYQLVFGGGEHFAFGEGGGFRAQARNPNHHPAIQALSVKFWDAYLKADNEAKAWLQSDVPKQELLESEDTWEWK
ncbi:MAG: hypothetical protein AAGC68_09395, partial [Verrucomicrobiota bacterium]